MPGQASSDNNKPLIKPAAGQNSPLFTRHARHGRMLEPLISLYQDGEASPAEIRTVEQYLAHCATCRTLLQNYFQIETGLNSYLEAIPVPRFSASTLERLDQTRLKSGKITHTEERKPVAANSQPVRHPKNRSNLQLVTSLSGIAAALLVISAALFYLAVANRNAGQTQLQTAVSQLGVSPLVSSPTPTLLPPSPTVAPVTATAAALPETPASLKETPPVQLPVTQVIPASLDPQSTPALPAVPTARPVPTVILAPEISQPPQAVTTLPVAATTAPAVISRTTLAVVPATTTLPVTTLAISRSAVVATTVAVSTLPATSTPAPGQATLSTATLAASPLASITVTVTVGLAVIPGPPASGWIAYVDQSDAQIHLIRSDGSSEQVVSDASLSRSITWQGLNWSNDGRWLAAVGVELNKPEPSIYLMDISNTRKLNYMSDGIAPVFAPSNNLVAYLAAPISQDSGQKKGQPAVYDLKNLTSSLLSDQPESLAPQWFDNGQRLLLGQDRVYTLAGKQTTAFKLPFTNTCLAAGLSPAGNKLAVLELQTDGKYYTVIYDFNNGKVEAKSPLVKAPVPLAGKVGQNCSAQRVGWSPTSQQTYFYVNTNPGFSTCLVQATTGAARCLANVHDPRFSRDETFMVDYTPGGGLVYVVPASVSSRPTELRPIAETSFAPAWQPR